VAHKKKSTSKQSSLKSGASVILEELPPGLLDGLPEEDQKAISAIVGVPIRFLTFDKDGRPELQFVEEHGTIHSIFVDRKHLKLSKFACKKASKRRK